MKRYRDKHGKERLWFPDGEIDEIMENELRQAQLFPQIANPVVDLEQFIENHLDVHLDQYAELNDDILGETVFKINASPEILINRILTSQAFEQRTEIPGSLGRWRATLAHEAAHVLLHEPLFKNGTQTPSLFDDLSATPEVQQLTRCSDANIARHTAKTDWKEFQANQGMAALLMPRKLFIQVLSNEVFNIDSFIKELAESPSKLHTFASYIAGRFNVSREAARIRLETLGYALPFGTTFL